METIDVLKPLSSILEPDERWGYFNRTLERHHALIAACKLHDGVPEDVRQHFENARNTFLYSWFAYRLSSAATLILHVAGELALVEKAKKCGIAKRKQTLQDLLKIAINDQWIVDSNFSIAQSVLHLNSGDPQEYCKLLVEAFRGIRNAMAHGETILTHDSHTMFAVVADMINQLFNEIPKDA